MTDPNTKKNEDLPTELIQAAIEARLGQLHRANIELDLARQVYIARIRELESELAELRQTNAVS